MEANSNEAIREALVKIKDINDRRPHDAAGYEINDIIDAALALPRRQCDVGTAEEHLGKFKRFCKTMKDCNCCPCNVILKNGECRCNCFVWAQMPYAEGGAK